MQFKEGADVFTADGEKAGEVERVVIDPKTNKVTHIVVQKGFLFTEEKVVPILLVDEATQERVTLHFIEDLDALPPLKEEHYVPLYGAADKPSGRAVYWYPPRGVPWWRPGGYLQYPDTFGYPEPAFVVRTEKHIPESTVALEEGAPVITKDGERVGDVERVLTEPASDRATHFVISQGLFLEEEKVVPTTWVRDIHEDEVHLAVSSDLVDSLPAYEG